jgi:T-complex protein 1 subunit delta
MMAQCERLLEMGIHPTAISDGFAIALNKSLEVLNSIATPVDLKNHDQLIQCVTTSLSSKVVSQNSVSLAPLAVNSVLKICDPEHDKNVDLNNIRVVNKMGGTIDDIEVCEGIIFSDNKPSTSAGGPTRVEKAKIALLQFCLSAPKTDIDSNIVVHDYAKIDKVLKQERDYIIALVKKICESGANVLLIQKSVLRDAVNDLALHFLAKKKIMVVKDIERNDVDFICNVMAFLKLDHRLYSSCPHRSAHS